MSTLENTVESYYLIVDVFACVYVHTAGCLCHDAPVEVRGQLSGDGSHFLSCANAVLSPQWV